MNWDDLPDDLKKSIKYGTLNEIKIYELNLPEQVSFALHTGKMVICSNREFIAMIKVFNQNLGSAINLWMAAFNVNIVEASEAVKFVLKTDYIKL